MGNGNKPYLKTRQDGYTLERNIVGDKQAGESEKPPRRNWDSPRRLEGQERGNQSGNQQRTGTPAMQQIPSALRTFGICYVFVVDASHAERYMKLASNLASLVLPLNPMVLQPNVDQQAECELVEESIILKDRPKKRTDCLNIDEGRKVIWIGEKEISLSRKEYVAIIYLYRKNRTVCSKDELIANVWPEASNGEGVSDSAIDQFIHRLRRKIEVDPRRPAHLVSKKGFGYILL